MCDFMNNLQRAEILSENHTKIKITTIDGVVIEGYSWGIEDAYDDDGNELDYEQIVIKTEEYGSLIRLAEKQIMKVEKSSQKRV